MAAAGGRGRLRASHADREQVVGTLKAAYVYGLVTKDEFDARVSQTLAARTCAELAVITADIPAALAPVPPRPGPAKADPAGRANLGPGERAVAVTAVLAGLAFVAAVFAVGPAAGLLALGATGSALVSLCLTGAQLLGSRRTQRSGGQLPPRRAVN